MSRRIDVTITYLEQRARPVYPAPPRPPGKVAILRAERCPVHFYRYLYAIVGEPWKWVSRKRLKDVDVARILADPAVSIFVLYVEGAPAGFAEIEHRTDKVAEIKFFGLFPDLIGRGLGRYFLANMLDIVWASAPARVALETCTLDHPAALPLYQKMGFSAYDQRRGVIEVTDEEAVKAGAAR